MVLIPFPALPNPGDHMQRLITITALAFLLAGCQTVIGHGPLALTEDAKQRI